MIKLARRVHPMVWAASGFAIGLLYLLGALSYQAADRELPPGTNFTMHVQQVNASETEAIDALEAAADDHRINLLRVGANPEGPDAPPWYFAFIGDRTGFERHFPRGAYPAFSPAAPPVIFPGNELATRDQPIRGMYAVQGAGLELSEFKERLSGDGFALSVQPVDPLSRYLGGLFASSSWPLLVTPAIGLALAIVYWIALSRRSTALQEFNGYSSGRIIVGQTTGLVVVLVVTSAIVLVAGSSILFVYNGGNQFTSFLPWVLIPLLGISCLALGVQLVASVAALRLPGYEALKGSKPARLLGSAAATSLVLMLVLVFAASAQGAGNVLTVMQDSRTFEKWESERAGVSVQINPNAFEEPSGDTIDPEVAAAYAAFGQIFNRLDHDGSAILSVHKNNEDTGDRQSPLRSFGPGGGNSIIVNNNYLERHRVLDSSGARLGAMPEAARTIHLLVPAHMESQVEELSGLWADSSLFAWDPISHDSSAERYSVTTHLIADGQNIFNYGDTWKMESWVQPSPVLAVVSPESGYLSDYVLLGVAANDGHVVFSDSAQFRSLADEAGLTQRFSGVNSPAAHAAQQLRDRTTALYVAAVNIATGTLALLTAVLLLCAMYADSVRFSAFLRRIHGWSTLRIHIVFISVVAAVSGLTVLGSFWLLQPARLASGDVMGIVACGVVAVTLFAVGVATVLFDRRVRAELIRRR